MLIVCTTDAVIVQTAQDPDSGSDHWRPVEVVPAHFSRIRAGAFLRKAVGRLGVDEPLCLSAHGNDAEIGDEDTNGWRWTTAQVAGLLAGKAPGGYAGPVLIHACASTVANFSAGLAVELEKIRALNGVWIYGYNTSVGATARYPDPRTLDRQVDLQGTQVRF